MAEQDKNKYWATNELNKKLARLLSHDALVDCFNELSDMYFDMEQRKDDLFDALQAVNKTDSDFNRVNIIQDAIKTELVKRNG